MNLFKKLDLLIIRTFIGPFLVTFFVALFALVMQFFFIYMDEMIGKGLSVWVILKELVLISCTLVPMALPLSILIASIMCLGGLGENYELVAMKSSGISLLRIMRPLIVVVFLLSVIAFWFNNKIIPDANLKAFSLLYDVRKSKPALNIKAGQFYNEIDNYSIKVGTKEADGETIKNVILYDQSNGMGNDRMVMATDGKMYASKNKNILVFKLKNGWRYQEGMNNGLPHETQIRMHFKEWDKGFDLSGFKMSNTNESLFKNSFEMMNIFALKKSADSTTKMKKHAVDMLFNYLTPYYIFYSNIAFEKKIFDTESAQQIKPEKQINPAHIISDTIISKVLEQAINNVRNAKQLIEITANEYNLHQINYIKALIEWHKKFTLAFACILLFLIGAPLGAIIRKGGLGMPIVVAIGIFIIYYLISITGEKLAGTETLNVPLGLWLATLILLPLSFILIMLASKDSQIFNKEWYYRLGNKISKLKFMTVFKKD